MTPHQAAAAWQRRQAKTLKATYTQAWQTGAQNYRAQYATPPAATTAKPAVTTPNPAAMQRALAPALQSLATMGAYLAVILPATAAAAAGTLAAMMAEAREYMAKNAWRLAAGVSVAWAGEQAGYAFAAARDGLPLEWQLDPNPAVHHCADCPDLAALPPMPLSMWPTLPGEGLTDCSMGCKCSMRAVPARARALTSAEQQIVSRIGNRQPVLAAA